VWFAAMVVAAAASALYVLFALDAEKPVAAGAMIACLWLSRPTAVWIAALFALEALRVCSADGPPLEGNLLERVRTLWARLDRPALVRRYVLFSIPILVAFAFVAWTNETRYGRLTPIYFDHEYLTVAWRGRMARWGMINYHFLAKNLGVALTSLPWLPPKAGEPGFGAPFKINEHGLALWFTTPLYFWLLWPKSFGDDPRERDRRWLYVAAALSMALPAAMNLLYQNTGWRQFGYRFSNDYSVVLFVMLALAARPVRLFGRWRLSLFGTAAVWSVAWNFFGAATFDKTAFDRFYFRDGSQNIVYQPD
jgi:hypothetical protein